VSTRKLQIKNLTNSSESARERSVSLPVFRWEARRLQDVMGRVLHVCSGEMKQQGK